MQNLWRVGKNVGQFEAVCTPKFTTFWDNVGDPLLLPMHFPDYAHRVSLGSRPLKLPLSCEIIEKRGFRPSICRGRGYPRFRTCIFKSHLLPSIWPVLVEFRSASSEGGWRKKNRRPNFDSFIYIHYATPPYSPRTAPFISFHKVCLTSLCWPLCATPGNEAAKPRIYGGSVKTPVLFLAVCAPKFMKFLDDVGDPSYFKSPCRLSISSFVQKTFAISSKTLTNV